MNPYAENDPVKIFTTPLCGYCLMAKRLLMSRGITFEEVDASGKPDLRLWLIQVSGQRTVPQIFIHGRSVGGYTELSVLDRAGELLTLVKPDT